MVEKREAEVENGANEQNDTSGEQMDCQEVRIDVFSFAIFRQIFSFELC